MNKLNYRIICLLLVLPVCAVATESVQPDITQIISKQEFLSYKDVGEFIDHAPKVTIMVPPAAEDIEKYGENVLKAVTGSDCDRDGKMDDNTTCNAVYYRLWLKYQQ